MDELANTIRLVAAGVYVNNTQTTAAIDSDVEFKEAKLSPREREVLTLYASGMALKQVAFALNIKMNTAKEHIDRVRSKYADIGRPVSSNFLLYTSPSPRDYGQSRMPSSACKKKMRI